MGFDYPKRITTAELAKILKITSSSLCEILRRGERSVVSSNFAGERRLRAVCVDEIWISHSRNALFLRTNDVPKWCG